MPKWLLTSPGQVLDNSQIECCADESAVLQFG